MPQTSSARSPFRLSDKTCFRQMTAQSRDISLDSPVSVGGTKLRRIHMRAISRKAQNRCHAGCVPTFARSRPALSRKQACQEEGPARRAEVLKAVVQSHGTHSTPGTL